MRPYLTQTSQILNNVPWGGRADPKSILWVLLVVVCICLPHSGRAQVQFPGPVTVELSDEALSSVSLPLEVGESAYMVSGSGDGVLHLHRYSPVAERFQLLDQFLAGGRIVHLIPWEGRPLLDQGVVAATTNPDRVVFIRVQPEAPHFTLVEEVALPEDPGTISFIGELVGGDPELAASLPGVDQVAFLRQEASWRITSLQDSGDQPYSVLGVDLDGDQIRELVTANRGWLSGNLGIFRRDPDGQYLGQQQDFGAGSPEQLAGYDLDGDGRVELAVTVQDRPEVVLLRGVAGSLETFDTIALTLPADGIHLNRLFDGTAGLFASNGDRALVDFFQYEQGVWARRNSYYPGSRPLAMTSGDFNGDGGDDLVSIGGNAAVVSVMFANSEPGFWGYPALALDAIPAASGIADFDGDGLKDLVVSNGNERRLSYFAGLPEGGFDITPTDFPLAFYPGALAVLNTDADPGPEVAILDGSGDRVHVADYVNGQGLVLVSETATGDSPIFISAADLDADGFDDLQIITREIDEVSLLFGAGDHTFPGLTTLGLSNGSDYIAVLDMNDDNLPDLVLSDGVNRIWTTLNDGDRTFSAMSWLNAGSGAGVMAVGDLDQDLDEDLIVLNKSDESLSMFENDGSGALVRRIGAHTLSSAPSGLVIRDLDQDNRPELVVNLRDDRLLGVVYPLGSWEYSQAATFSGGPEVNVLNVEDFNNDDVPDILTLDSSLLLGLTLLNVEKQLVAVASRALQVDCDGDRLEIRIAPEGDGAWLVEYGAEGRWQTLAAEGQALVGTMDFDRNVWILTVDRGDLDGPVRTSRLRLTVGQGGRREALVLPLQGLCPESSTEDLPLATWSREPWPNPFNPLVNARFALNRRARVQAGVYDLSGRRVAELADGEFEAGEHALFWDGRSSGRPAAAGVYLLRIRTSENSLVHKLMLVK